MKQLSSYFSSSHFTESCELQLSGRKLSILSLPTDSMFDDIMIVIKDMTGKELCQEVFRNCHSTKQFYILPTLVNGTYSLNIYRKSLDKNGYFSSYITNNNILINVENSIYRFELPLIVQDNKLFLQKIPIQPKDITKYKKPSYAIQSYDSEIIKKAKEISKFSHSDYHKLLSIHNWVARNLFYDYDSLINDAYKTSKISATEVLSTGKSVCQGYTELSISLMRALGIPAIGIRCYTLGEHPNEWENPLNMKKNETTHIFTAAWMDNRWILMDCTWDSPNRYEQSSFKKLGSNGIFLKYFDPTLQLISSTHRFVEIFV